MPTPTHSFLKPISARLRASVRTIAACLLVATAALPLSSALAQAPAAVVNELEAYFEFADYGGGVIFVEQIPADQWAKSMVIDARDAKQFAASHIPGAINIEWRKLLTERQRIPKDKLVLLYCNTGTLSAQAGLALRVAGWDNVRILQGGLEAWKAQQQGKPSSSARH